MIHLGVHHTAMILYYYDISLQNEGFDLKMMAENL
jgi:hypothetical protein